MINLEQIKEKLFNKGLSEEQISQVLNDLGEVVSSKILAFLATKFSSEQLEELSSLQTNDISVYIEKNKDTFSLADKAEIEKIISTTLEDYILSTNL